MFHELAQHLSMTSLSIVAMLLFLVMFTGAVVWACRRSRTANYQHMANLPLDDDSGRRTDR
jgi:cbb3-type cytochrome oxidase subunit 3